MDSNTQHGGVGGLNVPPFAQGKGQQRLYQRHQQQQQTPEQEDVGKQGSFREHYHGDEREEGEIVPTQLPNHPPLPPPPAPPAPSASAPSTVTSSPASTALALDKMAARDPRRRLLSGDIATITSAATTTNPSQNPNPRDAPHPPPGTTATAATTTTTTTTTPPPRDVDLRAALSSLMSFMTTYTNLSTEHELLQRRLASADADIAKVARRTGGTTDPNAPISRQQYPSFVATVKASHTRIREKFEKVSKELAATNETREKVLNNLTA
ncbi:hypothetical protein KEM54_006472, partial [Ascosphaera aggregata]